MIITRLPYALCGGLCANGDTGMCGKMIARLNCVLG
jgi:hypothetical protein